MSSPSKETPLISKGLRLVSIAVIIAMVAVGISAGYSAYQEYRALTNLAGSTNASHLTASFNGTNFQISGLTIPNNMTFPLNVELVGRLSILNQTLVSFDSAKKVIAPGQAGSFSLSSIVDFSRLVRNPSSLRSLLLNASPMDMNLTIRAAISPLLALNITTSKNSTMGPVLGGFQARVLTSQASRSPDGSEYFVPISLSWSNLTPIFFNGSLSVVVSQIPGSSSVGNYGTATSPLGLVPGPNSLTLNATLPSSDFAGGEPQSGNYTLEITMMTNYGSSATFSQVVSA